MKYYSVKVTEKFSNGSAVIYTKKEADERGIDYIPNEHWRDAKYGEYAETDDGYVTPVIKRNDNHASSAHLKTPTGCFHLNRSGTLFDTDEFYDRNSFTRKSRWNSNNSKLTEAQARFFKTFQVTLNPLAATHAAYPKLKWVLLPFLAKELLQSKLFREYMSQFRQKFIDAGITEELIVNKLFEHINESDPQTYPKLAQMAAQGLGVTDMILMPPRSKEIAPPANKDGAFNNDVIEEADFETLGAVKKDANGS